MQAGRDLDALIAEKVMGWKRFEFNDGTGRYWLENEQGQRAHPDSTHNPLPQYSTNIADAWKVVNHLLCHGWDDKHFFRLEYDNVELWDASFYKESQSDGGGPEIYGTANTPAFAICLAALKAVGR